MRFEGKVAIVTGGGSSIGLAIARKLAGEGAKVTIADIVGAEEAASGIRADGHEAWGYRCDVSEEAYVVRTVADVASRHGRIDILINNAAIASTLEMTPFEQIKVSDWKRMFDVNTLGTFLFCREVAPHMRARKYGRIVNFSSGTAFKGTKMMMHYVASKGAIISLTRALAQELGTDNVTANAVAPGYLLSAGNHRNPAFMAKVQPIAIATRAIPRDGLEEDLLGSICFLASDDAAFVTGQVLAVDGGSVYH